MQEGERGQEAAHTVFMTTHDWEGAMKSLRLERRTPVEKPPAMASALLCLPHPNLCPALSRLALPLDCASSLRIRLTRTKVCMCRRRGTDPARCTAKPAEGERRLGATAARVRGGTRFEAGSSRAEEGNGAQGLTSGRKGSQEHAHTCQVYDPRERRLPLATTRPRRLSAKSAAWRSAPLVEKAVTEG